MVGRRSVRVGNMAGRRVGGERREVAEIRASRECRSVAAESVGVRGGARLLSDSRIYDHTSKHISCARASHSPRDFHFSGRVFFSALLELARERSERSPQSIRIRTRGCVCATRCRASECRECFVPRVFCLRCLLSMLSIRHLDYRRYDDRRGRH